MSKPEICTRTTTMKRSKFLYRIQLALFVATSVVVYVSIKLTVRMRIIDEGDYNTIWLGGSSNNSLLEANATMIHPVVDDLLWIVPRPREPRHLGWEDDFMKRWKKEQYDPSQRLYCVNEGENSPYRHPLVCHIPGYVPARMPLSPQSQDIPRVIFLSWVTRQLGRSIFTSILSVIHHNPEYEIIFFTDDDVDRIICEIFPDMAPYLSGLQVGAARIDVWRMLMIERYGGVYIDMDLSSVGHLPIGSRDSVVTGVGCWGHLPTQRNGVLEHWSLAFTPHHQLIKTTLEYIRDNLRHPNNTHMIGENATKAMGSFVMRLTGPVPYQRALHQLLDESSCRLVGKSFCPAIRNPKLYCDYPKFQSLFGNTKILTIDFNITFTQKLLDNNDERYFLGHAHYDRVKVVYTFPHNESHAHDFCSNESRAIRRANVDKMWHDRIKAKKSSKEMR